MPAPTTLPPSSERVVTSATAVRRLTRDGGSDAPDWADIPVDTTAPRVTRTGPAAGTDDVLASANVTATFSEGMRAKSINGQTFMLFRTGSSTAVVAVVTYNTDTRKARLNPTNALRRGVTYKAVVTTGAKDVEGNLLDQNDGVGGQQQKVWFFTVGT
jgi:hypothetical protein